MKRRANLVIEKDARKRGNPNSQDPCLELYHHPELDQDIGTMFLYPMQSPGPPLRKSFVVWVVDGHCLYIF